MVMLRDCDSPSFVFVSLMVLVIVAETCCDEEALTSPVGLLWLSVKVVECVFDIDDCRDGELEKVGFAVAVAVPLLSSDGE